MSSRVLAFVLALSFLVVSACPADDCDQGCENCSADPVFVQRDRRDLETLARARQAHKEGVKMEPKIERATVEIK